MSKTITFLTLSVWAAALGSAALLGYAIHRPLVVPSTLHEALGLSWAVVALAGPRQTPEPKPRNIQLAAVIIRAEPPNAGFRALPEAPPVRELFEMRCGAWRGLVQGGETQEVRSCE
jgi:hypothetical protein